MATSKRVLKIVGCFCKQKKKKKKKKRAKKYSRSKSGGYLVGDISVIFIISWMGGRFERSIKRRFADGCENTVKSQHSHYSLSVMFCMLIVSKEDFENQ